MPSSPVWGADMGKAVPSVSGSLSVEKGTEMVKVVILKENACKIPKPS